MKTKMAFGLLGVFFLTSVTFGMPHDSQNGSSFPHVLGIERFSEALKLTTDQLQKIDQINGAYKLKYLKYKEVLSPLEIKIEQKLLADTVDYEGIKSILTTMSPSKIEMKLDTIRHMKELESILTAEQRVELKQLKMQQFKKLREKRAPH